MEDFGSETTSVTAENESGDPVNKDVETVSPADDSSQIR